MTGTEPRVAARVTHRFEASAERVFDAWLDPAKVSTWMAASGGEVVRIAIDARVGGSFSVVLRRDGEEVEHVGEYLEIDRPRRLVFTWAIPQDSPDCDRVSVDIVPIATGSELTVTHELHPDWADYASRTEAAWATMVAAIAAMLTERSE